MSWFERNPKKTNVFILMVALILMTVAAELILRFFFGLGNPVLYDSNPLYGFRLIPNQEVVRFHGAKIKVNNFGLRTNADWDNNRGDKVLFLGDSITYGGSYISNDELFSALCVKQLPDIKAGSAGVNAWGVENIYGLVVESGFLPAKFYVTTVCEEDFYRGLTRLQGMPFWCVRPKLAIIELFHYFCYRELNKQYLKWQMFRNPLPADERVADKAVSKLKEMDSFLKAKGFIHLIYITPSRNQVSGKEPKDELLQKLFKKYNLPVVYLLDRIKPMKIESQEIRSLFHDEIHLSKKGHALWGNLMSDDLKEVVKSVNR
ncbi:MAG TPA: hypothetical protein VMU29_08815 [Smithella sp.]|nr:hypothetical protein [Smithella sp.]